MMGNTDLEEMRLGQMDPAATDLTKAGRICGMISTALPALQLVILVSIAVSLGIFRH
jgi:hypothetical protein